MSDISLKETKTYIAVVMTCHNRCSITLKCLEALYNQEFSAETQLQVYLLDDGSTDGTKEQVQNRYPDTIVLPGSGNLFWNGGMCLAFAEAMKQNYDFYLWLNDDTILYSQAVSTLLNTYRSISAQEDSQSIIVGATQDSETGKITYSGLVRDRWWHPLTFQRLEPSHSPKRCDTICGNCVLLPNKVVQLVGNLDTAFTHGLGDRDYGLRARKEGVYIWLAPGYAGVCSANLYYSSFLDVSLPLRELLKRLHHPKASPPLERKVYIKRHAGLFWCFYWLYPYFSLFSKWITRHLKNLNLITNKVYSQK